MQIELSSKKYFDNNVLLHIKLKNTHTLSAIINKHTKSHSRSRFSLFLDISPEKKSSNFPFGTGNPPSKKVDFLDALTFCIQCSVGSWFHNGHLLKYLNEIRKMIPFYTVTFTLGQCFSVCRGTRMATQLQAAWGNFFTVRSTHWTRRFASMKITTSVELLDCKIVRCRFLQPTTVAPLKPTHGGTQKCTSTLHIIHGSATRLWCYVWGTCVDGERAPILVGRCLGVALFFEQYFRPFEPCHHLLLEMWRHRWWGSYDVFTTHLLYRIHSVVWVFLFSRVWVIRQFFSPGNSYEIIPKKSTKCYV